MNWTAKLSPTKTIERSSSKIRPVSTQDLWEVIENHDGPSMVDSLLPDDAPAWVNQLAVLMLRSLLPGVKLRRDSSTAAEFQGAMTAKAVVVVHLLTGQATLPPKTLAEINAYIRAKKLSRPEQARLAEPVLREIAAQGAVVEEIMPLVVQLAASEQERFFKAYRLALNRGLEMLDPAKITVEEKIVQILFLYWRAFARLKSVSEVHKVLAAIFIKQGVVISRDRIAKLCRRIGLRYRGRGRPRKSDK